MKMQTRNNVKNLGQIRTPKHIVCDMLDLVAYSGERILQKHIMDNACGDGAFLTEIAERYIDAYKKKHNALDGVAKDLEIYIHGIEIDKARYSSCLNELSRVAELAGITGVKWDVLNGDTLNVDKYNGKMDFVAGNPPYVRIHNLGDNFDKVRRYKFARNGMTDLFIVFYEIGFNMLNEKGKLVYITPNSFYSSVAGQNFRKYIIDGGHLYSLVDLGHYRPFKAAAYTSICAFDTSRGFDEFRYSAYSPTGKIEFRENLVTKNAFNNGKMILAKKREQDALKEIQNYIPRDRDKVQVKNAFATLADGVFIRDEFDFCADEIIDVLKASTGEWKKCIFPYAPDRKVTDFDSLSPRTQDYLRRNKDKLLARSLDKNSPWFAFGRSQAINDVQKNKIAVNTTVKDLASIKVNLVKGGRGVYGGLYILTDESFDTVKKIIGTTEFLNYIRTIGKCKSGGYYTFSSNDLKQYLYYKMGA